MTIFEDIPCVIIDDGANEVNDGVRGWGGYLQEDALCCKHISAMKRRLMSAT
jgi:hypothetical protein